MIKIVHKAIVLIYLCAIVFISPALAQDAHALINSYVQAIIADDDEAVKKAIDTIKKDPDALDLMKKEYREVYKSYIFEEALLRLYEIEKKFAFLDFGRQPSKIQKMSSRQSRDNSDYAGYRDGSTNQQRVRSTSNRDRLRKRGASIGREAQRSPNQDRRPNSTRRVRQSQR